MLLMEITLLFVILGTALVLFLSERIRADLVSMLVLLALALTGLVSTSEVFSGFSNPAVSCRTSRVGAHSRDYTDGCGSVGVHQQRWGCRDPLAGGDDARS